MCLNFDLTLLQMTPKMRVVKKSLSSQPIVWVSFALREYLNPKKETFKAKNELMFSDIVIYTSEFKMR